MMREICIVAMIILFSQQSAFCKDPVSDKITKVLKNEILKQAALALTQPPVTVTATQCPRSAGGIHDFYSEGDYWWPNPQNPTGPYIQRDGLTNPDNFTSHRKAMIRFSQIIGSLTSAYIITKEQKYINHAMKHLSAWFIDENTLMNPSLLYGQAIMGKVTGRGVGIIDMIQMMEVAQSLIVMEKSKMINQDDLQKIKNWFSAYLKWVTTHPYGIDERDSKNNHATCWVMQVAVFAKLVDNQQLLDDCKKRFKTILLPNQMSKDGSFPLELKRTKPYGYSLFNLDAMATICQVLKDSKKDLWDFTLDDNRSLRLAIDFMYPFTAKKESWKYKQDVMFWKEWPVAQTFLIFGYAGYHKKEWFQLWKKLEHFPKTEEVIRNLPVRNPLIWM